MRALHVYEKLDFQRGQDPKVALGIGIDPKRPESFIPFLIAKLPEILGTRAIPKDILMTKKTYIHEEYAWSIDTYVREFLEERGMNTNPRSSSRLIDTSSFIGYDLWPTLRSGLRILGFPSQ